jgi:hypothetical protein
MHLKIPLFSQGLKISNYEESQLFTSFWSRYHQWLPDIEANLINPFSNSYSTINSCFTAGKRTGIWNCHATCTHWKTTISTYVVYASIAQACDLLTWGNCLLSDHQLWTQEAVYQRLIADNCWRYSNITSSNHSYVQLWTPLKSL